LEFAVLPWCLNETPFSCGFKRQDRARGVIGFSVADKAGFLRPGEHADTALPRLIFTVFHLPIAPHI
jgi:hypothetical protein